MERDSEFLIEIYDSIFLNEAKDNREVIALEKLDKL